MNRYKLGNKLDWVGPKDVRHKGKFAFINSPNNFYYCREEFMDVWLKKKKRRRILLSLGVSHGSRVLSRRRKAVASLIYEIEDKLGIPDERKSLFNEMSFDRVLRVKVALFWLREPMRLSLFTLLLRAGIGSGGKEFKPNKDTIETCLFSQKLLKPTREAVKRFLSGKTHFAGGGVTGWNGWNSQLRDNGCDAKTLLKKKSK